MEIMNLTELMIAGTEDTPTVIFNNDTSEFRLEGRSLPEDVTSFYSPVFDWLEKFSDQASGNANFIFKLEYFNTASSKIILDILMRLEEILGEGKLNVNVEWHYMSGDDDMLEAGEEYKELVEIPFTILEY